MRRGEVVQWNEIRFLGKMESNELRDVDVKNKKKDWLKTILLLISMLILIIAAYHVIEILLGPVFERQFESPIYESDKVVLNTGRAIYDAGEGFMYLFLLPISIVMLVQIVIKDVIVGKHKIYIKIGMIILLSVFSIWFAGLFFDSCFVEPIYITLGVDNSTQTIDIEEKPLLGDPHNRYVYFGDIDCIKYEYGLVDKYYPGESDRPVQVSYGCVLIYLHTEKPLEVSFGFDGSGVESNRRLAQELAVATGKELICEGVHRLNR